MLCCSQNDVHTAVCADDIAELPNLQGKRGVFKRLLHLALREGSEIPLLGMRRAIGMETRQFFERLDRGAKLGLIFSENLSSLFLSACNVRLLPTRWSPTVFVLYQQMARRDRLGISTATASQML